MENEPPSWLAYERCVAAFALQEYEDLRISVLPNVKLLGSLSGVLRQVDVLVDSRWDDGEDRRIVIDAKERKRKVDVKDVEEFEGMLRDVNAVRGVIVCPSGYTVAAKRRAQEAITITMLSLQELEEYPWTYEPCLGACSTAQRGPRSRGMVLWGEFMLMPNSFTAHIVQTGKCDGCHSFHVWCWECGDRFAVADKTLHTCTCPYDWISWPEEDERGIARSMNLMLRVDEEYGGVIDRRPIR